MNNNGEGARVPWQYDHYPGCCSPEKTLVRGYSIECIRDKDRVV